MMQCRNNSLPPESRPVGVPVELTEILWYSFELGSALERRSCGDALRLAVVVDAAHRHYQPMLLVKFERIILASFLEKKMKKID